MNDSTTKATLKLSSDLAAFVRAAAEAARLDEDAVLSNALGARGLSTYDCYPTITSGMIQSAIEALDRVDYTLRVWNPGSQYVFRKFFVGYRRLDRRGLPRGQSSRSQIFASLVPRRTHVRLILPTAAGGFENVAGVYSLNGRGHHGVGDTAIDFRSATEVVEQMPGLIAWLGPGSQGHASG